MEGRYGVGFMNEAQIPDEEIMRDFSKYGPIKSIWRGTKTLVFVNFKFQGDAEQCLSDNSWNGKYGSAIRGRFEPSSQTQQKNKSSEPRSSILNDTANASTANLQYSENLKDEQTHMDEFQEQVERKYPTEKQPGRRTNESMLNWSQRCSTDGQANALQKGSFNKQIQKINISTNGVSYENHSSGSKSSDRSSQGNKHIRKHYGHVSNAQVGFNSSQQFSAAPSKISNYSLPLLPLPSPAPPLSSRYNGEEFESFDGPPPLESSDAGPPPLCSVHEIDYECVILLANLPLSVSTDEIWATFAALAPVYVSPLYETDRIHLPFCFIKFKTPSQAHKVLNDFDDTVLYGRHILIRNLHELLTR